MADNIGHLQTALNNTGRKVDVEDLKHDIDERFKGLDLGFV